MSSLVQSGRSVTLKAYNFDSNLLRPRNIATLVLMAAAYIEQLRHTQTLEPRNDGFVFVSVNAETGSIARQKALSRVMTEEQLRAVLKSRNMSEADIDAEILRAKKAS